MDDQKQKDRWLVEKVKEIVSKHRGRYGYRRIKAILENREQIVVNHKRLLRIMKTYNLLCQKFKNKSRTRYSSYKGQVGKVAPNKVKRNFKPKTFNQLWVTDVTEYQTQEIISINDYGLL